MTTTKGQMKVWLMTPKNKNVEVIKINKNFTYKELYPILHCNSIEYQGFTNDKGISYGLLMNSTGLYDDEEYNDSANKILSKIHLNWGTKRLNGYYIVYTYIMEDDKVEELYRDMDISIKEFITQFNVSIKQRNINMEEMMKEGNWNIINM